MANKELQELVDAYHGGQLNRQDYRRLRRELVDRLVEQQTMALADEESSPATLPRHIAKGQNHPPPPSTAKRPGIAIFVSIAAISVLIILGYIYFLHGVSGTNQSQVAMEMSDGGQATTAPPSWLDNFSAAAEWNPSDIEEVLRHWRALDAAQRQQLRQTPQFHRLMDILSRHLAEQRALAELNNAQAQQQAARLQELRDRLQQ